ncbi:pyridoxamine 5'-phosphate oxidase family protein [Desulfocicer vacuolatum]|nr:pyridoxamine 5'-phosphate oxidase family protein [Desulfocicer vacuolatum]
MRRKEKTMSKESVAALLNLAEEGVLATTGQDNYPYAVPLNYAYHAGAIYFHCAETGQKLDNIENNNNVSFCVIKDTKIIPDDFSTKFKSVVLFGKAQELFDNKKEQGLILLLEKYSSDYLEAGKKYIKNAMDKTRVFKIEIEHMTGKETI